MNYACFADDGVPRLMVIEIGRTFSAWKLDGTENTNCTESHGKVIVTAPIF